jgi:hypothetical protein
MTASAPGQANPAAFRIGQLSEQGLFSGYLSHAAAVRIGHHPRAHALLPPIEPGQSVPVGRVPGKNGHQHEYHLAHFLGVSAGTDEFDRVYLSGALITLGDALAAHSYFDHAPELELVRHLRNGVAHGNRFNITGAGRSQLAKWPAHNRLAWAKAPTDFEVTPTLNGTEVLWSFMEPGDVLSLFQGVGLYLIRMGNGDPLRP